MWLALSVETTTFWTSNNMANLLRQGAMIAILAIGETFVIITGGIDLSVGAVAGVISLSVAWLLTHDLGFASSIAGAISISLAIGVLHRPVPRLRRGADGPAAVHHDAGDDVRPARHRPADHQRRDDLDHQRHVHRLLARQLSRFSLDRRHLVRGADVVLDGDRGRRAGLPAAEPEPLGPLSLRHRLQQGGGAAFRRQRQRP